MRIAICDDNPSDISRLSNILEKYQYARKVEFSCQKFFEAMSLIEENHKRPFDLIFLDVLMPLLNGMETAHEIRNFDENVKIVFLTSTPEFAMESYSVKAFNYLIKPYGREAIFRVLDQFVEDIQKPEDCLTVKLQGGIFSILYSKLEYVEVLNKTLYFHLVDGTVRGVVSSLSDFEKTLLKRQEFVKTHRAFIVNMWQIQELKITNIVTHSGKILPVSRRLYPQIKEAYIKHLFFEKGIK